MRTLLILGSFYGLSGVILGAFGAHALKARIDPSQLLSYETGVRYQLIHAVLILVLALWSRQYPAPLLQAAGYVMAGGVALFSFSIYLLATRTLTGLTGWAWLGPVTPIGGGLMIIGWSLILVWAIQQKT
ncbi:MAG: DUF423 domain-containing protein [Kiritimatiellae bacterium]|nr:DUF423 domain-containing protein [Kiritimatiellia bacterium]